MLRSMWDLPRIGIEPLSPALAGGFPSTAPLVQSKIDPIFKRCLYTKQIRKGLSLLSDSLRPRGLQHARLPCLSLPPGTYSTSCPLSRCCPPTISSPVVPFSSHFQSFPASGSFPVSWLFVSGGQNIGASASVLPMNIQA